MRVDEKIVRFKTVRSGGPGGQRTNRRSTKVQMWVKIENLPLTAEEKRRIRARLARHINHRGELEVVRDGERFQMQNKKQAMAHLNALIAEALVVPKLRIPTAPTRGAAERRIEVKKRHGEKKRRRRSS